MSFWQNVASLAKDTKLQELVSSTLSTVESRIDRVLDIQNGAKLDNDSFTSSSSSTTNIKSSSSEPPDFFTSMLNFPNSSLSQNTTGKIISNTPKKVPPASVLSDVFGLEFFPTPTPLQNNDVMERKDDSKLESNLSDRLKKVVSKQTHTSATRNDSSPRKGTQSSLDPTVFQNPTTATKTVDLSQEGMETKAYGITGVISGIPPNPLFQQQDEQEKEDSAVKNENSSVEICEESTQQYSEPINKPELQLDQTKLDELVPTSSQSSPSVKISTPSPRISEPPTSSSKSPSITSSLIETPLPIDSSKAERAKVLGIPSNSFEKFSHNNNLDVINPNQEFETKAEDISSSSPKTKILAEARDLSLESSSKSSELEQKLPQEPSQPRIPPGATHLESLGSQGWDIGIESPVNSMDCLSSLNTKEATASPHQEQRDSNNKLDGDLLAQQSVVENDISKDEGAIWQRSSRPSSPKHKALSISSPKLNTSSLGMNSISGPSSPTSSGKDIKYLNDVVAQRERQLLQSMQDHAVLVESNNHLRLQVEEFIGWRRAHEAELEGEREDSGLRIGQLERALQTITKERDALRQQSSASQQTALDQTTRLLHEKDEEIKGLLLEGERLSKTELKYSNTIKQQKSKINDLEKIQADLTRKLEASTIEFADLKEKLAKLLDSEKRLHAANEVNEQQAKALVKLEGELSVSRDSYSALQSALDRAWQELAESRKLQAEQNMTAQSEALEKELKQNEELNRKLDLLRAEYDRTEASYKKEIYEIRTALSRAEDEAGWREDNLRKEVSLLQARLQAADARHEDLSAATDDSTRPLLRQIEALQAQHQTALRSWEAVEKNLTMRLYEAESERQVAFENDRLSNEKLLELKSRITFLEAQLVQERTENSRLRVELEASRSKSDMNERNLLEGIARLESLKISHSLEVQSLKESFKNEQEEQYKIWDEKFKSLEIIKTKESERRKLLPSSNNAQDVIINNNNNNSTKNSASSALSLSSSSIGGRRGSSTLLDSFSDNNHHHHHTIWNPAAPPVTIIDRLNVTIRQYAGQIAVLQDELNMAQKLRDELAEELVKLTNENESL